MAIKIDLGWKLRGINHKDNPVIHDKWLSDFMNQETLTIAIGKVADHLNATSTDQHLQEFVNRAKTDIGYDLTLWKGFHQDKEKWSASLIREAHFSVKATGKIPSNPGTNGMIYHIDCLVSVAPKQKNQGALIITAISYRHQKNNYTTKLNLTSPVK